MSNFQITRRETFGILGASAMAVAASGSLTSSALAENASPNRKRALRLAHLTDIHVQPELKAAEGLASCLHHVQSLADPVELILTGGDSIMDSFGADDARTKIQWDIWTNVLKSENSLPVRSAIGNHDIWGWDKASSKATGEEANYGKRRATDMLDIDNRYYTFAQNGWQFIVLDSIRHHPTLPNAYTCHLDEKQYDWLSTTLRDIPSTTPVLIMSHVPILSVSAFMWSRNEGGDFKIGNYLLHSDALKLKDLFAKHSNVKLSLSGHLHTEERTDYNGVTYLCNGSVCGNWWKGRHKDCDEGYAVLNLYDDGTFDHEYIKYGWKAEVQSKAAG
jgi:3',5'-cyclic-AMP phosphodiesterase